MRNVPSWMPPLHPAGGAAYLQIVAALEAALAQGILRRGDRLPPQRALAKALGVDLGTVTRAYACSPTAFPASSAAPAPTC